MKPNSNSKIESIKDFLEQYKGLNPYMKSLLEDSYKHMQLKLMYEMDMLSNHPYPQEYNSYINNRNRLVGKARINRNQQAVGVKNESKSVG